MVVVLTGCASVRHPVPQRGGVPPVRGGSGRADARLQAQDPLTAHLGRLQPGSLWSHVQHQPGTSQKLSR